MLTLSDMQKFDKGLSTSVTREEINNVFSESDDEKTHWLIMLFILSMYFDYDTKKLWESYAEEIKSKNRFFPESELLKKITDISTKATCYIRKGEILYRARDYSQKNYLDNKIIKSIANIMKEEFSDLNYEETDILDEPAMNIAIIKICGDQDRIKRISQKIENAMGVESAFYGYDKKDSDAPPSEKTTEGRANPKGISYLYAAKDIKTAILEMRPQMEKKYNIATIELIKDAKIFDFTYLPSQTEEGEYASAIDLHRISEEFSKPNFGDSIEYVPTQFLCEYIKRMGYDGIKYKSSVSKDGINILIFDVKESTRVYDVIGSMVYEVNSLVVDISQVLPLSDKWKE